MLKIKYDQEGKVIPQIVNYPIKHDDLTNDLINEATEKYWCSKCNRYHKRFKNHKATKIFVNHKEYVIEISDSKIWILKLNKSIDKYSTESHKKTTGSRKQ